MGISNTNSLVNETIMDKTIRILYNISKCSNGLGWYSAY